MGILHLSKEGGVKMQRYFVETPLNSQMRVELSPEDSHHLFTVMRANIGQTLELVDKTQHVWLAEVEEIYSKKSGLLKVIKPLEIPQIELPIQITIACGLSKNDKLDWIVQKATEMGMTHFQPLALSRDVVKWAANKQADKIDRLQKIANNAAQQSKRLRQPDILPVRTLKEFIHNCPQESAKLVAFEETAKEGQHGALKQALTQALPGGHLIMVFGSEGGLEISEVELLQRSGFEACSLGPRILRAETAPLYALAAISYHYEL